MLSDGFRATTKAGGYGSLLSQGRHEAHCSLDARISWSLSGFSKYDSERSPGGAKRNPGFRAMRRRPRVRFAPPGLRIQISSHLNWIERLWTKANPPKHAANNNAKTNVRTRALFPSSSHNCGKKNTRGPRKREYCFFFRLAAA